MAQPKSMFDTLKPRAAALARFLMDHPGVRLPPADVARIAGTGGLTSRVTELRHCGFSIEVEREYSKRLHSTLTYYVYTPHQRKKAA